MADLKRFFYECKIALRLTRKPTKEEFTNIIKITGIGILLIGALGFIIQMLKIYLFG